MSTRKHSQRTRGREEPLPTVAGNVSSPESFQAFVEWLRSVAVFTPVVLFLLLALDYVWVTEDAFITFQSVENLWSGFGPTFNRGLRVESFSHPLWFLVLCVLRSGGTEMLPVLAAGVGILLSVAGLLLASDAARRRFAGSADLFPFGAVIVAVLPPFWQFASSGLETGLTFFWIGLSSWCLVRMTVDGGRWKGTTFLVLGLAPIIRPDLVVFVLPLVAAAFATGAHGSMWRMGIGRSAFYLLAPGAMWQVFRMGYYGAVVPTTFIAKEGLGSRWDQGWLYLLDLLQPYALLPVVVVALLLLVYPVLKGCSARPRLVSAWALVGGALIHAAFVCRAGGDFMHGRLLLPALFALAAASAVVPVPLVGRYRRVFLALFLLWAAYVCLCARPPYASLISSNGIADERQWYVHGAHTNRPVTLKDYSFLSFYRIGEGATRVMRQQGLKAIYWAHIGITVAVIPDDMIVIDPLALNDHIGARIQLTKRGRPGHEKIVPAEWFLARYPPGIGLVVTNQLQGVFRTKASQSDIEAARSVLATPQLMELHDAVAGPMTPSRFMRNMFRAWRLTWLRIPPHPHEALKIFAAPSDSVHR